MRRRLQQRCFISPIESTPWSKELTMRIWESEPLYGRNQAITWKTSQYLVKKTCEIFLVAGVYQIRMSSSYIHEHLEGNIYFFVHQDDECLIRVKMESWHVTSKVYLLWIEYDASAVTAWYCKCKSGALVVGVCAHIASIFWFLGYATHNPDIRFGVKKLGYLLRRCQRYFTGDWQQW